MTSPLSAREVIDRLELEPLLPEGGWFSRIWYKPGEISAIYYLLEEGDFSEFHLLPHREHYFFLMGDPVELYTGRPGSDQLEKTLLGPDLRKGQLPSFPIEGGVIQGSRLAPGGAWALLSTVMNPPFEMEDYQSCSAEELLRTFPGQGKLIYSLTRL
ncbi:MAG: cupin domain-containing protein [Spirochaetales bacterium]|nr:cupin domain-containing protein [Spirochaetales bacterium]